MWERRCSAEVRRSVFCVRLVNWLPVEVERENSSFTGPTSLLYLYTVEVDKEPVLKADR